MSALYIFYLFVLFVYDTTFFGNFFFSLSFSVLLFAGTAARVTMVYVSCNANLGEWTVETGKEGERGAFLYFYTRFDM